MFPIHIPHVERELQRLRVYKKTSRSPHLQQIKPLIFLLKLSTLNLDQNRAKLILLTITARVNYAVQFHNRDLVTNRA